MSSTRRRGAGLLIEKVGTTDVESESKSSFLGRGFIGLDADVSELPTLIHTGSAVGPFDR